MENHYTYYSYEEWGRGYFGSRSCDCLPEEDINYFGSFKDKNFKPTQKIILKDDYETRKTEFNKLKTWMTTNFSNKETWKQKLLNIYNI